MIPSILILAGALLLLALVCWNVLAWPKVCDKSARDATATLAVLIPARDEEETLAACLDAVLAQEGVVVREVLVYDDHSRDRTRSIIEQYAGLDARVRRVESSALPAGWCGKTYACARLAEASASAWLLFLDADTRLTDKQSAARMLSEAEARRLTLLSCWPELELRSFWEKALMPLLNLLVFTLFPAPLSLRRDDARLGIAHGACLLVKRAAYMRVGGHAAVRDEIIEDISISRLWRESGERGLCLDGVRLVRTRMYRSFAEIWRGFGKNFYPGFRQSTSFWAFLLLHFVVFLLPFLVAPALLLNYRTSGYLMLGACACVLAMRVLLALRFRQPLWAVLLHPLSETILLALGLASWWQCRSGRGVEWKGRRYRTRAES